ncbi:Galactose-1-phosphate uridyl transferase, N-terminal domain [Popillia japonica]|uniref:Galactose-1-phosphate uridylyltransferase n=1 Tax=Popillia japonica TaxID=7064 RepID=A0AAW1N4A5_POPJA
MSGTLLEDVPKPPQSDDPLFQTAEARGTCRVMCFHPKSNVYLSTMSIDEVKSVISEWINQTNELGKKYIWVQIFENRGAMMGCSNPHPHCQIWSQIFENRGAMMGCSNPHPHCQIWSSSFFPNEPKVKGENQRIYFEKYGRPMLMDYVEREQQKQERIVCENEEWVVVVPYWAIWPFETMVLPKRHILRFSDFDEKQKHFLAELMRVLVAKYDNLFQCSFPYSMGWHGAPTGSYLNSDQFQCSFPYSMGWHGAPTGSYLNSDQRHWTFHGIYLPPLLRSATVKKFIVGYIFLRC